MDDFIRVVKRHYPDKKIEKGYSWNTLRVDGNIVKVVPWDRDDPTDIERARSAFETERKIYSMLPAWWGIRLIDSFEEDNNFIIVTNELKHCKWTSVGTIDKPSVFADIEKQLNWLHSNGILHDDLELKNILLSCDGKHATIIDFEKSRFNPTPQDIQQENNLVVERFDELNRRRGGRKRINRKRTYRHKHNEHSRTRKRTRH